MDPVTVKFIQLIFAELLGAVLAIAGIYLFLRGVSGKSSLVIQGAGVKAKLLNAAPGGLVLIAGVVVLALSLNSSVVRTERTSQTVGALEEWLANSYHVTDDMDYKQVIDTIVGTVPNTRFVNRTVRVKEQTTLGTLAAQELKDSRFWHLVAAINKDRGFFTMKTAQEKSIIPGNSIMEIWVTSKYSTLDVQTVSKVAAADRAKAYDDLLKLAQSGAVFASTVDGLSDQMRTRELTLTLEEANLEDVKTLRDLSLKYYRAAKYWPLIVWSNPDAFAAGATEETAVPGDQRLLLPVLLSGAHVE